MYIIVIPPHRIEHSVEHRSDQSIVFNKPGVVHGMVRRRIDNFSHPLFSIAALSYFHVRVADHIGDKIKKVIKANAEK